MKSGYNRDSASMKLYEAPLLVAIFLDLVGFGMAFPDIQLRAEELGASGPVIGLILSSLFGVQILASPRWGLVSDKIGRKPVFIICTLLSALSMLIYAVSTNLWGILFSRILAGFAAANVVAAQAYLADRAGEKERGAAIGRISGAISVGLIAGPFIGGLLVERGGSQLMGLTAASASILAVLVVFFGLPADESIVKGGGGTSASQSLLDFSLVREVPLLRQLFVIAAVAWFALACLEGTFGRLLALKFDFPLQGMGMTFTKPQGASGAIFAAESLVAFLVQGVFYGMISRRISDIWLLRSGYILQGIGLLLTPFLPSLGLVLVVSCVYSGGAAVASVTVNTNCSGVTPESRQGELFGMLQSARSVGFLLGPILGGWLFDINRAAPYVMAGLAAWIAATLIPRASKVPLRS